MSDDNLPCWVYRSPKQQEMYLFMITEDDFSRVPAALLDRFGTPILVIELELNPERKLAREDIRVVMSNLRTQGFHLQMPEHLKPRLYHGNAD